MFWAGIWEISFFFIWIFSFFGCKFFYIFEWPSFRNGSFASEKLKFVISQRTIKVPSKYSLFLYVFPFILLQPKRALSSSANVEYPNQPVYPCSMIRASSVHWYSPVIRLEANGDPAKTARTHTLIRRSASGPLVSAFSIKRKTKKLFSFWGPCIE